uniref:NADH dehydrogenase subunit 3 n=1 Tax=Chuniphyes multidentata TaxID=316200 RepID=UPI0026E34467|nr:NADH dehydrogenase subunit 3 [Chuniphyes multidentata]WJJ69917.1 NADH dehydrogenase subunit 3 [Chuniphyes multidentata]
MQEYNILFFCVVICVLLAIIINLLSMIFSEKVPGKEKVSAYECGFNPIYYPGEPFSIRFFVIALLFLIFDLEILYLFPWANITGLLTLYTQVWVLLFIFLLIIGLAYEWSRGGLEWQ